MHPMTDEKIESISISEDKVILHHSGNSASLFVNTFGSKSIMPPGESEGEGSQSNLRKYLMYIAVAGGAVYYVYYNV